MNATPQSALLAATLLFSGIASAATAELDNFQVQWQNSTGGELVGVINSGDTTSIRWGSPSTNAGQSGYDFTAVGSPLVFDLSNPTPPFLLGTFSHINNPIALGTEISSVELMFNMDVSIDGSPVPGANPTSLVFQFQQSETDNDANPCADGGANNSGINANGCADIVSVSTGFLPQSFEFDGQVYTINVLGFSTDGGLNIVDSFFTAENATTPAGLYATITTAPVPEPETYAMLLAGLGLVGYTVGRRRRAV